MVTAATCIVPIDCLGEKEEYSPPAVKEGMFIWVAGDQRSDEDVRKGKAEDLTLWYII